MTNMMDRYRRPASEGGAGKTKAATNFKRLLHDYDRRTWQYYHDTLNCAYPTTVAAYTGSQVVSPLVISIGFQLKKSEWQNWITDVDDNL